MRTTNIKVTKSINILKTQKNSVLKMMISHQEFYQKTMIQCILQLCNVIWSYTTKKTVGLKFSIYFQNEIKILVLGPMSWLLLLYSYMKRNQNLISVQL